MIRLKKEELFKAITKKYNIPMHELYSLEESLLEQKREKVSIEISKFKAIVQNHNGEVRRDEV